MKHGDKDRFLMRSTAVAFFVLAAFGVWTIYTWIALWSDWTFLDLRQFSFLLIPLLLLLVPIARRVSLRIVNDSTGKRPGQTQRTTQTATLRTHAEPPRISLRWLLPALLLLVASLALTATKSDGSFSWQWLLFAIACLLLVFVGFGKPGMSFSTLDSPDRPKSAFFQRLTTGRDAYWYLSTVVFLLVAYAFSTNTDAADTHFLGAVVSLLQFPDTPLFAYDSIFGEEGIRNYIFRFFQGKALLVTLVVPAIFLTVVVNASLLAKNMLWMCVR